jgi:glutamyl-tRNA synthetase
MIVTRFAPSPTGYLHIGGLRTALFSYLHAKRNGGKFVLRIEDTDKSRNSQDATQKILEAFKWVGLKNDGEVVYQSKRDDIYKKYIDQLLDEGKAYRCYMSKEDLASLREEQEKNKERTRYNGAYRDFKGTPPAGVDPVIRIKSPQSGVIEFEDGVKGFISFKVDDILDDFIIARSDKSPTYNFVVAVDDALMGINEVIRGDDHLSNTPKQIVVYNALNLPIPKFYHVAMIHNESGKKLSKRDGATDVMQYKEDGFLPEALLNFLVRLGWSHGDQEIFTIDEMIKLFDPKNINRSASVYNTDKLLWLNGHYINTMDQEELEERLKEKELDISALDKKELLINLTKEKARTINDLANAMKNILDRPKEYQAKSIKKHLKEINITLLKIFLSILEKSENVKTASDYETIVDPILEENKVGMGKLAQAIRIAIVGSAMSPSIYDVMEIVGREEIIIRIKALFDFLEQQN